MRLNCLRDYMKRGRRRNRRTFTMLTVTLLMVLLTRISRRTKRNTNGFIHNGGGFVHKSTHNAYIIPFLRGQGLNNQLWEMLHFLPLQILIYLDKNQLIVDKDLSFHLFLQFELGHQLL